VGDEVESALVGIGPRTTIARHRAIDEAWIELAQHVVTEAELFERALAKVLDDDVCVSDEAPHDLESTRVFEVHREAALVAVQDHERHRLAVNRRLPIAAHVVSARELLDLDHVGAHIGEQEAAGGTRHDLRDLDYLDAVQDSCHG